jgi:HAMP domain-containing protein
MSDPAELHSHRPRRWLVAALLTLAVISGVVAVLSTWVRRQALDTHNWTNTSSRLLADPKIQDAVGGYLVNQLFANVDVAGQLRGALPPQAAALAGPASGGLQELANRAAPQLLTRPRVQDAWRLANSTAHRQLLAVLNGGGQTVSTANGEVVLNLHSLVDQLAQTLGVEPQVNAARGKLALPPSTGRLVIMRAKQLKTAQDLAKAIHHISIIFTALTFGLFALAVWLARGWRRLALRGAGWCLFGLGVFTLLVRRALGDTVVDALVRAESVKPAAHDAWLIGTSLLRAIALAMAIFGLLLIVAAWLAGPTRPATALRQTLAPRMRDHPVAAYGTVGLVYLLVLVWGPTPAFRHWIPVLLLAALLALGVEMLRRQTDREFPDARAGDGMRTLRAGFDTLRGRREPATATPPLRAGNGNGVRLEQLERLSALHDSGALTDDEYSAEKGLLLRS